jgi:hypothetical protein
MNTALDNTTFCRVAAARGNYEIRLFRERFVAPAGAVQFRIARWQFSQLRRRVTAPTMVG